MKIERMTEKDRTEVIKMMRVFYASDAVMTDGSDEIFTSDISACVGDSPYAQGYVFMVGENYAGYAMLAKSFSTEFGKPCIWIEDIYIKPDFRKQGIGTAFFDFLFDSYKGVIFRLEAEKENTTAMALYKKCGFDVLGYVEMINRKM